MQPSTLREDPLSPLFGGSPIPLLKTASRKSNWPFHASRKIRKAASRSQNKKKITLHVKIQIIFTLHKHIYKYHDSHCKNVFRHFSGFSKCVFFSTLWIDRNTMTIFELFCGLSVPFQFFPARSVNLNLFYLRLVRAVFERTYIVNVECSNGHCASWCIRQERTSLFQEKQNVFARGKRTEMSNLEATAWKDDTRSGMRRHYTQTIISSKRYRTNDQ